MTIIQGKKEKQQQQWDFRFQASTSAEKKFPIYLIVAFILIIIYKNSNILNELP